MRPTCLSAARRARHSVSPAFANLWRIHVDNSHSPTADSPMQSTLFGEDEAIPSASSCGKTSQESSVPRTTRLAASLLGLPVKSTHSSHQGANGRTLVLCLDPRGQSAGASSTPNISEWPNAAAVCSLSQVLERGSIPARFYLSPKACAGILRRSDKRGKELPTPLHHALTAVAQDAARETSEDKILSSPCSAETIRGGQLT